MLHRTIDRKLIRRDSIRSPVKQMLNNYDTLFEESEEMENNRCKKCGADLITAPDGTTCCPYCGLVVGPGYSCWFSSPAVSQIDEEEDTAWNGTIDNVEMSLDKRGV